MKKELKYWKGELLVLIRYTSSQMTRHVKGIKKTKVDQRIQQSGCISFLHESRGPVRFTNRRSIPVIPVVRRSLAIW